MKTVKTRTGAVVILATMLLLSGCSTMSSAYDSTVSTVSGWFGKDSKKAD